MSFHSFFQASLPGVDCQSPVTKIDKCYCDREVPSYKRCVKDALDELNPEEANATVVAEISVILQRLSKWEKLEPEVGTLKIIIHFYLH